MFRKAYQTLEDRDIQLVEIHGPFRCCHDKAWLGSGYYFWDSFLNNAHWWGREGARYSRGYVICESTFELDENKCFNLVDNPDHLHAFNLTKIILMEQKLYIEGETTVARVIEYLKRFAEFNYEAIRAYGINSVGFRSEFSNRTIFIHKEAKYSNQYLDSSPAIQINFFEKNSLNRKGFKIIYPPKYSDENLI